MNQPTFLKKPFLLAFLLAMCSREINFKRAVYPFLMLLLLLTSTDAFCQLPVPFTPRLPDGNMRVKGDIVFIGNNIVTASDLPLPYNGTEINNNHEGAYVNVASGGDPSIFSSSSADLITDNSCKKILYAGLYWASVYPNEIGTDINEFFEGTQRLEDWNEIKFKLPTGGFIDLVADANADPAGEEDDIIFDGYEYYGSGVENSFKDSPIICYKNVTNLLQGLSEADGEYTVANLRATRGFREGGCSAGWTLVVIYESPTLPSKYITLFDGYAGVQQTTSLDIPVSGFQTLPAPYPVNANLCVGALEGDIGLTGDSFQFKASTSPTFTVLSDVINQPNNFFNSTITRDGVHNLDRNPASRNTLGLDINNLILPNPLNSVLPNDATAGALKLTTNGDGYGVFVTSFSVEIIEPNIVLTKIVEDDLGNNIGGQVVGLSQPLNYVIGFQNTGNDDAINLQIRDILPINIIFNYPTDLVLPAGVTVDSYNPATRELIFNIEDYLVEENDPVYEIRIEVMTVETCSQLADSCSNIINNQAFATYSSETNPGYIISDDPSYSSNTGCLISPQATNFLADLDDCVFEEDIILCGSSVELTAANGYDSYSWSTSPTGIPVIGTTQTITVTSTGTYYVFNTAIAPCQSIEQTYNVTLFGGNIPNPVIPFADEVVTCPNDGKLLPLIFLCGENDSQEIQTNLSGVSSIIWEQLDEASCAAVANPDCANENSGCTWNQVGTGPDFTANTAGQFRLTINYEGGCFNQFYFNVYQNLLNPTVTATDIICTTPGSITVGGVPSGYEYSLDGSNYQPSNVFSITAAGIYTVYIRQIGVDTNPCIFSVPDIQIRERDFTVSTIVTQPFCNGDLGTIHLAANDADPQYFFSIYQGATLVNSVGPINANNYTFANLNPGTYTATVETEDGCTYSEDIQIIEPPLLTVTAALTIPLTCSDGEITVYPVGGTPPYFYFINSTTDFQTVPEIIVTAAGVYDIMVVDANNCSANTTITVEAIDGPDYNITKTDISCASDANSGVITINVTNANGNSLLYSIDGGVTFSNSPVFSGLAAGDYNVVVQSTIGTDVCLSDPDLITIAISSPITGTPELTTAFSCTSDGTITVTGVAGGTPPYSYSIDGVTFQSGNTFGGLTNGTYTITVQDTSECPTIVGQITIAPLNPPTDLSFSSSALTCPSNTSTVTITGTTGGVLPLEYQIIAPAGAATGYQTSNVFADLPPGTYTFQVKDANDCIYSESYTITALPAISVVGQNISDISCFGASDGSVQFTVSGSSGFTYTINGGTSVSGTSPIVLTGLSAGTYTILITDSTTNCEATDSVTVNGPANPLAITTSVNPMTCIDSGSVIINATGGWGGNTYGLTLPDGTVLAPQSNNTFVNLTQDGTYTVSVEDANGCIVTDTFDLTAVSAIVASISTTSDVCYDGTNGATIEVSVSAGQAPFEYSSNGGAFQTSNSFSNLVPGSYIIVVRDAFGCTLTLAAETIEPQLTLNTVLTKDLDCTLSPDAIITGNITGGSAPFIYSVSIDGGGYTSLGTTGTPFTYSTASPGTFQFQITDDQGCSAQSGIITINPISLPELDVVAQTRDVVCHGDSNGAIQVTFDPTVGTPPFTINVFNDTTGVDYGTQTTSLPAGSYTITLTDAKSCTDTDTIVISEPDAIVVDYHTVDITCTASGVSQGSIIIDGVTGGTPPYNYFVTGTNGYSNSELNATGTTSVSFDVVDFGLYQINVVDVNGCSVLIQDVLVASPPTDLDINIDTSVDCSTGGEAVISIGSSLPSAGPFFFSIYQGPSSVYPNPPGTWIPEDAPGSQTATFTGLTPGVFYTFIVYDASTNCSYYEPATAPIPTNSTLTATAVSANNITCNGSADGTVSFTVNSIYGISTDISYEIFDSLSLVSTGITGTGTVVAGGSLVVSDLGPLPFGNYYVLINETTGPNAGCGIVTVPFNITESAIPLSLSVSVDQNANCNVNSGVISAVASNGTAPYLYQVTTTPASPLATDPLWASASTFNLDAGSYYVHVVDAYGCVLSSPVTVLPMDPSPVISTSISNACTAVEGSFAIDVALVTVGIPPYSFSIDGGAFQTQTAPFTVSNLSSGTHTVEVRDSNGCGNLVSVTIEMPLGLSAAVTALPSCTNDDGVITVTTSGGTGTYSYAISPNPASISLTGNVYTGVPSGTYTITMTDTTTLCTEDVSVTLDATTPVTFTTTVTDVSCNGDTNGVITVNLPATNDNPVYTYEITAPIVVGPQNSNIFTGLSAGTYTIQVVSGRGCISTADVVIGEPVLLEASGIATDFECAPDNSVGSSTVTISEVGGTGPFTYSINGTNYFTNNTFEILDSGSVQTITIYVKDANGCIATNSVEIDPLPTLTLATATIATPIDCNNTGTVAINVTGGSGNFTYQMLPNGTPQASNIFSINAPGDYYFQVNDVNTGCTIATLPFTADPFDSMEVIANASAPVSCFGEADGALEITINDYVGNYTYEVFNSSGTSVVGVVSANTSTNPQLVSGLPAGNYTVVVVQQDSPFCDTTSNMVTIESPATPLDVVVSETSNVTCTDDQGTITAIGSGGTAPYEYELTGAATVGYSANGSFTNLSAGVYIVNIRDAAGCIAPDTVTLVAPTPINATFTPSTTLLSCFGDDTATITVTNVTGGQGSNYTYTLNRILPTANTSGPQTSPIFGNLGAGTYSITINDSYNCSLTSMNIVITEPSPINASLVTNTTQTCLTESTLTLSATGGTGPYSYSTNGTFSPVLGTFASSTTFSVPVGTYQYYVRDANGCITNVSNEITIDELPPLTLNLDAANSTINCTGDTTGVIFATAQGGLGNYVYTLQDAVGNDIPAVQNSPGVFTELGAGTYYVRVDSGDCATTTAPITITEPSAPLEVTFDVTNVLCFGGDNGAIVINATGGTGIIKYAISPQLNQFFDTNTFENLAPGTYQVVVQDVLGCYVTFDFSISEPPPVILSIVPNSLFPEVCEGDNEGEFSIDISGGTSPYSVSLDDYDGTYTTGSLGQTQFEFTGLGGGDHTVFVRDALGCESEWNITFPESVFLNPIVEIDYTCVDNASSNIVTVIVDESITDLADVDYSLNGGSYQASNVFINVVPGVGHYIDVRHTNGCIVRTELFDITDFDPLSLVLNEGGLNEIIAVTTGGSGIYEYTLNGDSYGDTNTFIITQSGSYTVTVTDSNGCVAMASLYFEFTDICIPNYFTPNADGVSDGWAPGCVENYPELEVDIFDRYGRKVAILKIGEYWDGKYNGYELPTGDYWYVVTLNNSSSDREFVGHFTLYR